MNPLKSIFKDFAKSLNNFDWEDFSVNENCY